MEDFLKYLQTKLNFCVNTLSILNMGVDDPELKLEKLLCERDIETLVDIIHHYQHFVKEEIVDEGQE